MLQKVVSIIRSILIFGATILTDSVQFIVGIWRAARERLACLQRYNFVIFISYFVLIRIQRFFIRITLLLL